ncbi:TPA: lysozyme inhibitor LprI family protein [Escherichia coli]
MSECYIQDYNKSKEELSSTYNKVITLTSSKQRELLISSQEKWFDYMNADCEFETHASRYGKIKIMVMTICLQVKTEQRISDLKKMLNCSDGDSSCGFD